MEKKNTDLSSAQLPEEKAPVSVESTENTPETAPVHTDEEHSHGNYMFAVKVIAVLLGIILLLVILKVTGVRFSLKELFADAFVCGAPFWPFSLPPVLL